jgi:hypothetical protein
MEVNRKTSPSAKSIKHPSGQPIECNREKRRFQGGYGYMEINKRNINCSIRESLERFRSVIEVALDNKLRIRGYVSCVLGCPYAGSIAPEKVSEVALLLSEMGCHEISLEDTIGSGNPHLCWLTVCVRF